ncbi:hypothetical protein BJX99DRAFT_228722 [Aspergillus californicus]
MTPFQRVALLGKGYLGSVILDELVKEQFTVTLFTRSTIPVAEIPSGIVVRQVDYTSLDNLTAALQGVDVVIVTVSPDVIHKQKVIIDAAILAGVKRLIPAEFGAMTSDPVGRSLPVHADAVEIQDYLAEKADAGEIEYTLFGVGAFLGYVFTLPIVVEFEKRSARVYDGGENRFSVSHLPTIARAVIASLRKPAETRNRVVRVHDGVITQKRVLDLAKQWTPGETWTETPVDSERELRAVLERIGVEGRNVANDVLLFKAALLSGKYGSAYETVDNELLGLGFVSDEELEQIARSIVKL